MTIALGFHCTDGVVLAADSEISNAYMKYQGDKAWIYKYPKDAPRFDLQLGIVGAGDASFIQFAAERIDAAIETELERPQRNGTALTMPEVNGILQGVLNDLHHTHLYPIPQSYEQQSPRVELLIGILLGTHRNRLAKTSLTALTKVMKNEATGIGSPLANFIIKKYAQRVTVAQAVFIATQVLRHVKEHAPACVGQRTVIAMFQAGTVGWVSRETLQKHERWLNDFDAAIEPVFLGGLDPQVSNPKYHERVEALGARLKSLRKAEEIEIYTV